MKKRIIIVISAICLIVIIIFWWINVKNSPKKVAETLLIAIESNDEKIRRSVLDNNYYDFLVNNKYCNIDQEELDKRMLQDLKRIKSVPKAIFGELENLYDLVSDESVDEEKERIANCCNIDKNLIGDIMKFTYYLEEGFANEEEVIASKRDIRIVEVEGIWYAFFIY